MPEYSVSKDFFLFTNSAVCQDCKVTPRYGDSWSSNLRFHRRRYKPGQLPVTCVLCDLLHSCFRDTSKSYNYFVSILRTAESHNKAGRGAALHRLHNDPLDVEKEDRSRQLGDPLLDGTG